MIKYAVRPCEWGQLLVASRERGMCAVALGDNTEALVADLQRRFAATGEPLRVAELSPLVAPLLEFIEQPCVAITAPLAVSGTEFQRRVWRALQDIPPGQTVTYQALAERIGAPRAVRAVANACGANPIALAIPCHRVVRSDGRVSGYRWGAWRKQALLKREAAYC
jgi:AraC family transcriptional regulator of adaptative response/methylated-DNA-[protein]-cysteine methyltransferase